MKNHFICLVFAITLLSCGGEDGLPDIIKFKSGAYGSKAGQFTVEFPGKPDVRALRYMEGTPLAFDEFSFQYNIANEHIYAVNYGDYPESLLNTKDTDEIFEDAIRYISEQLDEFEITDRVVNEDARFEKSITYTLYSPTPSNMMKARIMKTGNRIYFVYFACIRRQPENDKVDRFLNSFQIYQPKTQ